MGLTEVQDLNTGYVYDQKPMLVYWESTQACDLACVHCRADAKLSHHPMQLNTEEAKRLLGQIAEFGDCPPHVVITGGDPLRRPDLFQLLSYGRELGLRFSVTPAGTERLNGILLKALKASGVRSIALSLDGSTAGLHDTFRSVEGSFEWTMNGIKQALELNLDVQINTMVTAETLADLPGIFDLLSAQKLARWALFFLIPTGRGSDLEEITPAQSERLLNWLVDLEANNSLPFPIKTTEAHHYRRIAVQRSLNQNNENYQSTMSDIRRGFGIRDGNGILFVSHLGEIYPSGFLPLSAGNVRLNNLVSVYQSHELFRSLRYPSQFHGKCGFCEFNRICGGSRARAYAVTGDPTGSDPLCPYQPRIN